MKPEPLYLAGEKKLTGQELPVINKYSGEEIGRVALADLKTLDAAIEAGVAAKESLRKMPAFARKEILLHCACGIEAKKEEFAKILALEGGKALQHARLEVARFFQTFVLAAEESTRLYGEYLPLDISAASQNYESIWKRVPVGLCSFIVPFNFPLNLAAHKIAPAIAAGCPFVVKPASYTPLSLLMFGEILATSGLPRGAFSILPATREVGDRMVTDPRFQLLSFTGSPDVGWDMKTRAGKKKVVLELGGNAACIVDQDADLEYACERMLIGAFYQSGQSCISVQRLFIHEKIYEVFKAKLVVATKKLKMGDPLAEDTFIGPLISEKDAVRVETWIREAVADGATVLTGGGRKGAVLEATLLEGVKSTAKINCQEAFGPVAILAPFKDFKEVLRQVNDSAFGLQAGIFTANLEHAFSAFDHLEVGGIVVNDVPSLRVDSMPYGGVKDSGLGREGVRFALQDMTEIRHMVLNRRKQS